MAVPKKLVLVGWDAAIVKSIEKYVKEGKMPTVKKMMDKGVWGKNCLVPHPTITPPNWTTIVTGSWPGTHGITCFHTHKPGTPLTEVYDAFTSEDCRSEYVWQAAEKAGKKSIIVNYPSTWPPTIKNGIQIGGAGLSINAWRSPPGGVGATVSTDILFTTDDLPMANQVEIKPAKDWKNFDGKDALEAELKTTGNFTLEKMKEKVYYLLIKVSEKKVIIAKSRDTKDALCEIGVEEWSAKIIDEFETDKGKRRAVFMCKLLHLSLDGKKIRLFFSSLSQLDGWSYPPEIAKELEDVEGMPLPAAFIRSYSFDWISLETMTELIDIQNTWFSGAVSKLMKDHEWDLFFMHAHCPDFSYHNYINKLDPTTSKDKKETEKFQEAERSFYMSLDKMTGKILEAAGDDVLFILTSDHGAVPTEGASGGRYEGWDVSQVLLEKGIMVLKDGPDDKKVIDWTKTKAVAQRSVYVYVNLKGRDPDGIVEPGEEYENVCDEVISALYDYTDPKTGKKPISLALKKKDARIIGLYGDMVGDVIYGVRPETPGEHGRQLPTADYGIGSIKGVFLMAGPGIKQGEVLERTIWLTDIVPTICYSMDLPVPKDAEGAVIYQAFENPDFKIEELEKLKKNYKRVKGALDGQKALTHSYGEF